MCRFIGPYRRDEEGYEARDLKDGVSERLTSLFKEARAALTPSLERQTLHSRQK